MSTRGAGVCVIRAQASVARASSEVPRVLFISSISSTTIVNSSSRCISARLRPPPGTGPVSR